MKIGACMIVDVRRLLKICLESIIEICVMVCSKYKVDMAVDNISLNILSCCLNKRCHTF